MVNINLYHVFYKMPVLVKEDMYVELEELAERFVKSGLLRIDAEPKQNFVRFSQPTRNVHIVFSQRQLYDQDLLLRTRELLGKALREAGVKNIEASINLEIDKLRAQLKKFIEVEPELEMQLARILVQSAHPVAILMIMFEKVEVYISYGHNIGEVMDVVSWQQAGTNSGMQSTDGKNVAVFVSCGGDPLLFEPNEQEQNKAKVEQEEKLFGDGKPALARLMGIAGQEIGHYSDIIHDKFGRQIGRYSANFNGTRANETVNAARITDMNNISTYWNMLLKIGVGKLIDRESEIRFMRRNPNKSMSYYFKLLLMKLNKLIFIFRANRLKIWPITDVKDKDYTGIRLQEMFSDMAFNLAPVADVYKSSDKNVEIAIACIEALARVPQQVNKWGHRATMFFWRNLYKFYYYKVIPECIKNYEHLTGNKFNFYPKNFRHFSLKEKIKFKIEKLKQRIKYRLNKNK